jgi:hypothetical protein
VERRGLRGFWRRVRRRRREGSERIYWADVDMDRTKLIWVLFRLISWASGRTGQNGITWLGEGQSPRLHD